MQFHADKGDYAILRECLSDSRRFDANYNDFLCTYRDTVTVLLSERDFYRCGWEMSKTNIVSSDFTLRTGQRSSCGVSSEFITGLVFRFMFRSTNSRTGFIFDENVWPYGSIKRTFIAMEQPTRLTSTTRFFNKVEKIVMTNLSKNGTISPSLIKDYENDQQTR